MIDNEAVSRRTFVGGVASAVGAMGLPLDLLAQGAPAAPPRQRSATDEYDGFAKLANNENPYGPSAKVLEAMTKAFKYANRYGYPDGNVTEEIAKHHGVRTDQVMIAAGSGEILDVCCTALLQDDRRIVGSDPSYSILYQNAANLKADTIRIPLLADFRQDIPAMIRATKKNHRQVGFVYLCNPNNPTGRIVTKDEVRALLDGIPEDVPVLIDEAYHHFVEDPAYESSMKYVAEGRPVIVARTFSKIAGLAGMRLGYAVANRDLLQVLRPYSTGSVNACVRWGGAAALNDAEGEARVRRLTLELRKKAVADLKTLGYDCIPSEANFFMVHLKRPVVPVIEEFRKKGVLVGRPFPPLNEHLRVSVGTADEMERFMAAFRQVIGPAKAASGP
ncbi:MAG: aminotransferase class I/II-fold pyridoxal phosphate-dependent enzyme [Gemmatimonadaceae bacterium]|nr:aminotransferase class I/II-fold pyridoxal phosphate-dependent enzyme [Gemmatimonadaceae bacterium]